MNKISIKNIGIGISLFLFLVVSCQNASTNSKVLSVPDFEKQLSAHDNPQLIDVRTPEEFNEGHLDNAKNIDWNSEAFEAEALKLEKDKPVFVYCHSGSRSKEASEFLFGKGFNTVYDMEGGYKAWTKAKKEAAQNGRESEKSISGITHDEYKKLVTGDQLILVDFNAPWCGPCKVLSPVLAEVEQDMNGKLKVVKINVDRNQELAGMLAIEHIPALYVYKSGQLVWQQVGLIGKEELTGVLEKL